MQKWPVRFDSRGRERTIPDTTAPPVVHGVDLRPQATGGIVRDGQCVPYGEASVRKTYVEKVMSIRGCFGHGFLAPKMTGIPLAFRMIKWSGLLPHNVQIAHDRSHVDDRWQHGVSPKVGILEQEPDQDIWKEDETAKAGRGRWSSQERSGRAGACQERRGAMTVMKSRKTERLGAGIGRTQMLEWTLGDNDGIQRVLPGMM
jgi:hypothetical protein